jgi:hypothetical protein
LASSAGQSCEQSGRLGPGHDFAQGAAASLACYRVKGTRRSITALARTTDAEKLSWSNYGPVIASECSKRAIGSHPCRVVSVSYDQMGCCHGTFGNFWECTGTEGNNG